MSTTRRNFIKYTGLGAGSLTLPISGLQTAFGQGTPKILVNVFLRGGADGFYLCPTLGSTATSNEKLAVFNPDVQNPGLKQNFFGSSGSETKYISDTSSLVSSLALDNYFVLHPQMTGFKAMYDAGELAIVHGVGGARNHSHFAAQDAVERARPHTTSEGSPNGWLHDTVGYIPNATPPGISAVAMAASRPEAMNGNTSNAEWIAAIPSTESGFELPGTQSFQDMLEDMFDTTPTGSIDPSNLGVRESVTGALDIQDALLLLQADQSSGDYSDANFYSGIINNNFVDDLRDAVRLIKSGYGVSIINIDLTGWDTHVDMVNKLWTLAYTLSAGLYAFYQDLTDTNGNGTPVTYNDVCTLVLSEFGRTLDHKSSLSTGTDHGDAGAAFVIGGGVNGGSVYADTQNPKWRTADNINERAGRFYWPVTTDYRSVFDSVLGGFMGLTTGSINGSSGILGDTQAYTEWSTVPAHGAGIYTGPVPSLFGS